MSDVGELVGGAATAYKFDVTCSQEALKESLGEVDRLYLVQGNLLDFDVQYAVLLYEAYVGDGKLGARAQKIAP